MDKSLLVEELPDRVGRAVTFYWRSRADQKRRQRRKGSEDRGSRGAVTGGFQMDGFIELFSDAVEASGLSKECVHRKRAVELPGFFRPSKKWDLVVVRDGTLIAAIEAKSQVGPSFGNNFNNRTEEAVGSALDFWTAYRDGAFAKSPQPFVGYFFMLEDCSSSNAPVAVQQPHFGVFPEFLDASYMRRYELLCRKLVLERHYTSTAFISSKSTTGLQGAYQVVAEDL